MYIIGHLFGFLHGKSREAAVTWLAAAAGTVFTAAAAIFYALYPDWMWMYYRDPGTVPLPVVLLLFAILYYLPLFFGLWVPRKLPTLKARAGVFAVAVALQLLEFVLLWNRYARVGTYEEFQRGGGVSLFESRLLTLLNIAGIVVVVSIAVLWIAALKARKPADPNVSAT